MDAEPTRASLRQHLPSIALIVATHAAVFAYWQPSLDTFPIDDPYIHLVYGRNLALGLGFAYNAGEPSMGTSSPLWTVVVALVTLLAGNVIGTLVSLGSLLLCASAVLLYLLVFHALRRDAHAARPAMLSALLCAGLLLTSGNTLWISFSGMETTLYVAMVLLAAVSLATARSRLQLGLSVAGALLTRLCGAHLIMALLVRESARARKPNADALVTLAIPAAAFSAFSLYSWHAVGTPIPTTVGGKKATYVAGDFDIAQAVDFVVDYFALLLSQPAFVPLVAVLLGYGAYEAYRVGHSVARREPLELSARQVLAIWALLHLGAFALTFRSLLHYGRYLIPLLPAAIAVSALCAHELAARLPHQRARLLPAIALSLLLAVNLVDLPRWKRLYHHDLQHIRETYVQTADWVREHTEADAVIAAYDIGVIKYYTGRRIVDLFGLLDERLHPLLRKREAASYLRESAANYVLYLQSPNAEHHTRVYLAEYGDDYLLDQRLLTAFRSAPYPQPTITQSFGIEIFAIDAWHGVDAQGRRAQFIAEQPLPDSVRPVAAPRTGAVQLVGIELDAEPAGNAYALRRVLNVPTLGFRIALYWRAVDAALRLPEVEVRFVDPETEHVWYSLRHAIAHGRVDGLVRGGEIIREPHFVWLPQDMPSTTLDVRVIAGAGDARRDVLATKLRIVPPEPVGL